MNDKVTRINREQRNGHSGCVLWMTGLSGAGKSTLAEALENELWSRYIQVVVLDGDVLRRGLCSNLGFSPADRGENLRRAATVAKLLMEQGIVVICSFITPTAYDRENVRSHFVPEFKHMIATGSAHGYHTVYVKAPLELCEQRDPKGLYRKARAGQILEFTGLTAPYEPPAMPDLEVDTQRLTQHECITLLLNYALRAAAAPHGR